MLCHTQYGCHCAHHTLHAALDFSSRLGTLLERYDLPRRLDLPETAWRQYLLRDKKRSGGEMTIAVLERPGHGVLWSVTPEELLEETRWM